MLVIFSKKIIQQNKRHQKVYKEPIVKQQRIMSIIQKLIEYAIPINVYHKESTFFSVGF